MKKLIFVLLLGCLAFHAMTAQAAAQDNEAVANKINQSIRQNEPKWKLVEQMVRKTSEEDWVSQRWRQGKNEISLLIQQMASSEEAAESVEKSVDSVNAGVVQKLPGLADEAIMITREMRDRTFTNIIIRKGNKIVYVRSYAQKDIKKFAEHVARQLE
jgi:hypothetical protein